MVQHRFCNQSSGGQTSGGSPAAGADTVLQLSEEERVLCCELEATYERLHVLAREQEGARLTVEVERAQAIFGRLQQVAAALNPLRQRLERQGTVPDVLRVVWGNAAGALDRIVQLREGVLATLRAAAAETRGRLVHLGRARAAIGCYRHALLTPELRRHGRRV